VQRRPELPHDSGSGQAVPLDVTDHERGSPARCRHDVVPVTADLGVSGARAVADGHGHLLDLRQLARQQRLLQGGGHIAQLRDAAAEVGPGGALGFVQPGPVEGLGELTRGGGQHLHLRVGELARPVPPEP
jgi:hypothetical protein